MPGDQEDDKYKGAFCRPSMAGGSFPPLAWLFSSPPPEGLLDRGQRVCLPVFSV
jgi:hypothetical protein